MGTLSPCTLEPWSETFPEDLSSLVRLPPRPAPTRKRGRVQPAAGDTNNFRRTGFSRLPSDAQIDGMTKDQLREFLGVRVWN